MQEIGVSLRLNETEEGTIEIPEEYDAFDEENDYNLGFKAEQCLFEVSDIAVYCDETEANRPPGVYRCALGAADSYGT